MLWWNKILKIETQDEYFKLGHFKVQQVSTKEKYFKEIILQEEVTKETISQEVQKFLLKPIKTFDISKTRGFDKAKFPEDISSTQDFLSEPPDYEFANPCPLSMRQVKINWFGHFNFWLRQQP